MKSTSVTQRPFRLDGPALFALGIVITALILTAFMAVMATLGLVH